MAFCPNCGTNNVDGAVTCANCNTPLPTVGGGNNSVVKNDNLVKIIGAAVVAFIFILIIAFACKSSPKDPIKNYVKVMNTGEAKHMKKVLPKAMYAEMKDELDSIEDQIEEEKESMEEECGKGKFKYKVINKEKIDKDDIEDMESMLEMTYGFQGIKKKPRVTGGYEMKVELTYDGKEKDETETETLEVYKVNGQWCLLGGF